MQPTCRILAFRTTLTKYLENLRHQCIYPSSSRSSASSGTSAKSKPSNEVKDNSEQAWWWKDVIVRKSFWKSARGQIRATHVVLSTHALMRSSCSKSGYDEHASAFSTSHIFNFPGAISNESSCLDKICIHFNGLADDQPIVTVFI
ncbi:hypothetical protein BJ912DRAFT_686658 [Pholiota molesta]|nr:hypothetical protein BJ912DRAFT_686658 [Pholiota molesta]